MENAARPTSEPPAPSILHLIKQVQYKAYVQLEAVFQPLDVTAVQFRILTTLSTRPALSSAALARLYDVKPQTMIKQVALLESKGLISRRVSATNKRLLEVSLTARGTAALARLQRDSRALEASLLEALDDGEQDRLRDYLSRLLHALNAPAGARADAPSAEEFNPEYHRAGVQRL